MQKSIIKQITHAADLWSEWWMSSDVIGDILQIFCGRRTRLLQHKSHNYSIVRATPEEIEVLLLSFCYPEKSQY